MEESEAICSPKQILWERTVEMFSDSSQIFKIELFAKLSNGFQQLTIIGKSSTWVLNASLKCKTQKAYSLSSEVFRFQPRKFLF